MKDAYSRFISILADNSYVFRPREIPEDFDYGDYLMSKQNDTFDEDENEDEQPQKLWYNGFDGPVSLGEHLFDIYSKFEVGFLEKGYHTDSKLSKISINRVSQAKESLIIFAKQVRAWENITLDEMIGLKIKYADKALDFLNEVCSMVPPTNTTNENTESLIKPKKPSQRGKSATHSFQWRIGVKHFDGKSAPWTYDSRDIFLKHLHKECIDNGLFAPCADVDFMRVFQNVEIDKYLVSPLVWIRSKVLLAYFFQQLIEKSLITNYYVWAISEKCFRLKMPDGTLEVPYHLKNVLRELKKSYTKRPQEDSELVDILFEKR